MQKELEFFRADDMGDSTSFPESILVLDTETTGLDPLIDKCVEIGVILFDVKSRAVLAQNSFLLPVETNSAENINKIPAEITLLKYPWKEGIKYFEALLDQADVVLAHNAAFDRKWFGIPPLPVISKPWICSMEDISWPSELNLKSRPSVRDLAISCEVPVWSAHRALTDCIYLVEVLRRCKDLEILLERAMEPRRLMRAVVTYDERFLAKNAGFRWNDPIKGAWARRLSEREIRALTFPVVDVQN